LLAGLGVKLDLISYALKLGDLFPSDDRSSPAMWRLAILRDDIGRELDGLVALDPQDDEQVWEHVYFLRRLPVSILEAKGILEYEVSRTLKQQAPGSKRHSDLHHAIGQVTAKLAALESLLKPVRNAMGAHVRPDSANPTKGSSESYEIRGLRSHAQRSGKITLNRGSGHGTSYRDFTKHSILFAWPEVTDDATFRAKAAEIFPRLIPIGIELVAAIDAVLMLFWLDVGAFGPKPRP
jgi:hypothetical protein